MELTRRQFFKAGAVIGAHLALPDPVKRLADTMEITPVDYFNGGVVKIYAGKMPARPSLIDPGMHLADITLEPFDLWRDTLVSRGKEGGTIEETGVATHFVLESPSKKFQAVGTVGRHGCTLNMCNTSLCTGGVVTIDTFTFAPGDAKYHLGSEGIKNLKNGSGNPMTIEQFFESPVFSLPENIG